MKVDPDDKRGRLLLLTAEGRRGLARAVLLWQRTHASLENHLGEGEPERLRRGLRALS